MMRVGPYATPWFLAAKLRHLVREVLLLLSTFGPLLMGLAKTSKVQRASNVFVGTVGTAVCMLTMCQLSKVIHLLQIFDRLCESNFCLVKEIPQFLHLVLYVAPPHVRLYSVS